MKRKGTKSLLCAFLALSSLSSTPVFAAQSSSDSAVRMIRSTDRVQRNYSARKAAPNTAVAYTAQMPAAEHLKDYWDFEGNTPLQSKTSTHTALTAVTAQTASAENSLFGQVYRFPTDPSQHAWLQASNYINTGQGRMTFALWYKYDPSQDSADGSSVVLLQHTGSGRTILSLRADGHYHTYLNATDVFSEGTVAKGEWQHVAISFDQDAKKVRFYINGKFDSEKDLGNTVLNQMFDLRIGHHKNDTGTNPHGLRGDLDELCVYDTKLSDADVLELYAQKGKGLLLTDLEEWIAKGQTLCDDSKVSPSAKTAVQNALDAVEALDPETVSINELQNACETLKTACQNAEQSRPAILHVEDEILRTIDPDSIFGINHRYAFNAYGTFDDETMQVKDEFKTLYKDAGFGSIRYPGGSISNLFNWKTTLGPKEQRKKQVHAFYNNGRQTGIDPNFGLEEIASFADEVDSDIVYVYSLARGSAQDASDLIEFLNAKVGTNPNGGIDWAKVRSDYGHPEPYNVQFFEIGNEIQQCYGINNDGKTTQGYWIDYRSDGSDAVHAFTLGAPTAYNRIYAANPDNWDENASRSDGSKNMVRQLRHVNTNTMLYEDGKLRMDPDFQALENGAHVYVGQNAASATEWTIVDSLENAGPNDQKCTLNYSTGEITFGDGVHGAVPASGHGIYASYSVDHDGFNDVSEAIRQTQSRINELESKEHDVKIYTAWENVNFVNLENQLGKADLYDGMTIHPYSGTVNESSDEAFLLDAMAKAQNCRNRVMNYLNQMPEDKVPAISEFGIYYNTSGRTRSQLHALYVARCIMDYAELGSPYIQKHCLSDYYTSGADALGPTQQAVIQVVPLAGSDTATGKGNFGYFATPSAHVFQIFNAGFGTELLNSSLSQDYTLSNNVNSISVLASRDEEHNYSIAIENADPTNAREIQIELPETVENAVIKAQRLESNGLADENSLTSPANVTVRTDEIQPDEDGRIFVTVQPHSFLILRVYEPADKTELNSLIELAKNVKTDGSAKFTDLKNRLDQAQIVSRNEFARPALVQEKSEQLTYALEQLLDPSLLETAVNKAETLKEASYAKADWTSLQEELSEAKEILRTSVSQAQVNETAMELNQTLLALRRLPDPAALEEIRD